MLKIPQPGATWAPVGKPTLRPHEYIRGGTAKLLTLFRPATGEVRAKGVTQATSALLAMSFFIPSPCLCFRAPRTPPGSAVRHCRTKATATAHTIEAEASFD